MDMPSARADPPAKGCWKEAVFVRMESACEESALLANDTKHRAPADSILLHEDEGRHTLVRPCETESVELGRGARGMMSLDLPNPNTFKSLPTNSSNQSTSLIQVLVRSSTAEVNADGGSKKNVHIPSTTKL